MEEKNEEINLFVPGRVSIIGELSDWVCEYKHLNDSIVCGEAVAAGIDKGIYATVKKSDKFIYRFDGKVFECEMDNRLLEKEAKSNDFYAYVSAVALYMNRNYDIGGLDVTVRNMTLPIQKGLSSSAAVCVLVTKAYNILYDLELEFYEIMKIAYESEHIALSKCGRLDQICAKGLTLSHLMFNVDSLDIQNVKVKEKLYFVIADLNGKKDTKNILSTLHSCFPFPQNEQQEKVKRMLCEENKKVVATAIKCISEGDLPGLGAVMTKAQILIDESAGVLCEDLKAPLLHKVMNDETIKTYSYGSKGTGSNGDGCIVILAKNEKFQAKIEKYLEEKYNMSSFKCNFNPTHEVKKAVVPVAGYGTRMYPFTRNVKKAFLPIIENNLVKPIIFKIVEELEEAGIEKIALVVSKNEEKLYKEYFKKPISNEHFEKLNKEQKEYELRIQRLGEKITFIIQDEQLGYGHAVYMTRKFANGEPVLVALGDTIYKSKTEKSCTEQILSYYDKVKEPIVSLHKISKNEFTSYGIVYGKFDDLEKREISIEKLVEKPYVEYAEKNLCMDGNFFGTFGMTIIDENVYDALENNVKSYEGSKKEVEFTDALDLALQATPMKGLVVEGKQYDLGNVKSYLRAIKRFPEDFKENSEYTEEKIMSGFNFAPYES